MSLSIRVPPTVAVSDLQGKNRRTLCTLEQGKRISYGAASDGESLFLIVSNQFESDTESFYCELLRIDMTTGEGTSLYKGDAGVTLELAGCVENGLVVKSTLPAAGAQSTPASSENPELGTYANTETQLILIDKNGNRKPFMRWTTGECTEGVLGDRVFYFRDGNVMACDPLTGQETQIATGFSSYDPTDIDFSGYDGGVLFMDAVDMTRDENPEGLFVQVRYAIDVEDGTIIKIDLSVKADGGSWPPYILACDEAYFLLETERLIQEISVDGIWIFDRLSVLAKEDLYASEPNYSLVEPAFGPGHIRTKTEVFSYGGAFAV